jgi:hypothetical protein
MSTIYDVISRYTRWSMKLRPVAGGGRKVCVADYLSEDCALANPLTKYRKPVGELN